MSRLKWLRGSQLSCVEEATGYGGELCVCVCVQCVCVCVQCVCVCVCVCVCERERERAGWLIPWSMSEDWLVLVELSHSGVTTLHVQCVYDLPTDLCEFCLSSFFCRKGRWRFPQWKQSEVEDCVTFIVQWVVGSKCVYCLSEACAHHNLQDWVGLKKCDVVCGECPWLVMELSLISRPSRFSACNIEKRSRAFGRGYME